MITYLTRRSGMFLCLVGLLGLGCPCKMYASDGFDNLVQVVKSGADEKTLLDYVNASPIAYALSVDEILYLSDLGLSAETIKAICAHGQTSAVAAPVIAALEQSGTTDAPPVETTAPVELLEVAQPAQDTVQEVVTPQSGGTAPVTEVTDYSDFYLGLAPYGNWIDIDGERYWQPTAVLTDPGWRPYCQRGRWVYSDNGWVWESTYTWGWAPFHYGRWRQHSRFKWIWLPDKVWGPSWVCWRYSSTSIGWAPLPPEARYEANAGCLFYGGQAAPLDFEFGLGWGVYTFVPVERFCDPGVARYRIPSSHTQQSSFHGATVVQNRIGYQQGRICNFGPSPTHITAITHREIHPVKIVPRYPANPQSAIVQAELRRGRESRTASNVSITTTPTRPITMPVRPLQPVVKRIEQQHLTDELAHQRRAEENTARLQNEQRRLAEAQVQAQNAERQRAQEQAQMQALADQKKHAADISRQQDERRRAEEAARQQESLRQVQEMNRRQEIQHNAQVEAQRQALRAQRENEEAAARQREEQARISRDRAAVTQQHQLRPPQPDPSQTYSDPAVTGAASRRGATSRDDARHAFGR